MGDDLRYYQFLSKYARWNEEKGRRETWRECVDRVMNFCRTRKGLQRIPESVWNELKRALFDQEVACSSRLLQMAGPALERCHVAAYNCAYLEIDCLEAFAELFYVLLRGSGAGFSVESECIGKLPRVQRQTKPLAVQRFPIPDSAEGWCDALLFGLQRWFAGEDVQFDFSQLRPAGARLKTTGGRAAGPHALRALLTSVREKVLSRQGLPLTALDTHDICCMIGRSLQASGVRRAAEISLSDLRSTEMRFAKSGEWWETAIWRSMANNSAVYEEKPDLVTFMEEWRALAKSSSGERGIFNRWGINKRLPARRQQRRFGVNPCGETILRSCEFCNLSSVIARYEDSTESLQRKVRLAAIWGTLQSTLTDFRYLRPVWKENCEEERLLGVDITGQVDCPILRPRAAGRAKLLGQLKQVVLDTNAEFAGLLQIPRSAATTCVKPSGSSSLLYGCSSGVHPRYAKFQVRRIRANVHDPLTSLLKDAGVPWAADTSTEGLVAFEFYPEPAPAGTPTRDDLTAIEQLENWLEWNREWVEHSVSCTVYVEPREWLEVGSWIYRHFDEISSITFLPKDGGTYELLPNEELDQKTYWERREAFPQIDWTRLTKYETHDMTSTAQQYACVSGACEL